MPSFELFLLCALIAFGWFFIDGLKARDIGVAAARNACATEGLQFLDDTVASNGIRLRRNDEGRLCIQRTYAFEYSDTGNNRCPGTVTLVGYEVAMLYTGIRTSTDETIGISA
ncbi:MAG TPA: DUF3301 domain-containing protein, partial [Rhodocyclaceae bacterium]|nr:DUF3301 domain-containing protein [Rhodocyclaceae bacterium]